MQTDIYGTTDGIILQGVISLCFVRILIIKTTRCTNFSKFILPTACEQDHVPARKLSTNLYDIYHCCVYSGKLLMMHRGTVRNM